MTDEFETGLPSVRQMQALIKDNTEVEVKLVTSDLVVGKLRWQDTNCLCVIDHYDQPTIVWKQAIVFVKPKA
ncbi:RNA-binding protein hfq [Candidatus Synechococcus calcipolaris G9]|uniref:RNA-binding protein hfq n=1 Tax=Candidatus Synechococcus calcipolaris G9 TaxID=1497997 RepID=A0ABT6ETW8_9SYNE|nr:RNA-binding protein hfq [Candidatus Synechococcus calcipolaris]MDG2989353.1 RNA-binding protein hfq [Candidatus Synechococcus calcipolaris G9]